MKPKAVKTFFLNEQVDMSDPVRSNAYAISTCYVGDKKYGVTIKLPLLPNTIEGFYEARKVRLEAKNVLLRLLRDAGVTT